VNILIIGLNYLPESTSIGPYTADLAGYLQSLGHQVQVVAGFPMAPQWRVWDGYRGRWFMREVIQGVPVLRTYLYVPEQPRRTLNRILFDMSFFVSSLLGGLTTGRCDLIVCISPPLQLGLSGWLLGLLKGARFFLHLQDLVPDAAVATGMLREGSLAVRLAQAVERFVYRRAHGIGVICDGFARNLIAKGVPPEKIAVLPNYIDLEFMRSTERNNGFRQQQGFKPGDFLVMYSGSVALKQGLHTFIETAAEFRERDGVVSCLVGEGPYLQELKTRAEQLQPANLCFLPLQPRENLPVQLAAADALVITQKRVVTDVVFPGKLLYYMAAGRPILAAVSPDSETGRFVNNHQVGLVVPPEEPGALAQAIQFLRQNRHEADRLGRNGRRVAEERFDRRVVLKQFAEHLEALANSAR
jgi:colanic acid biosynthesis glycosyl transferase WcaI